jgi:hypothetical protein
MPANAAKEWKGKQAGSTDGSLPPTVLVTRIGYTLWGPLFFFC